MFVKASRTETQRAILSLRALSGLSLLHRCGWVHGDVSANNILLHNGVTKISDLEFAKKHDELSEHDRVVRSSFTMWSPSCLW